MTTADPNRAALARGWRECVEWMASRSDPQVPHLTLLEAEEANPYGRAYGTVDAAAWEAETGRPLGRTPGVNDGE